VLLVSCTLIFVAMLLLGFATNITTLIIGGVFYGLGNGINSPTVMAWAIDLSHENYMGRAISTVYMALELGIGIGALLAGFLLGNLSFPIIFSICSFGCLIAFIFLVRRIWWG
jgi:MFS family permease